MEGVLGRMRDRGRMRGGDAMSLVRSSNHHAIARLVVCPDFGVKKKSFFHTWLQVIPLFGVVKAPHPLGMFSTFIPNKYMMFENFHLLCLRSKIHSCH
jgi:hypothetical protein